MLLGFLWMQYRIKYVLLSHGQWDDVHSRAVVAPITHAIQLKLSTQFRDLHRDEQIRLYKYFERMSESRKVAGIFYEAIVQSYLQDGRLLELVPIVSRLYHLMNPPLRIPNFRITRAMLLNQFYHFLMRIIRLQNCGECRFPDIFPNSTVNLLCVGIFVVL